MAMLDTACLVLIDGQTGTPLLSGSVYLIVDGKRVVVDINVRIKKTEYPLTTRSQLDMLFTGVTEAVGTAVLRRTYKAAEKTLVV